MREDLDSSEPSSAQNAAAHIIEARAVSIDEFHVRRALPTRGRWRVLASRQPGLPTG